MHFNNCYNNNNNNNNIRKIGNVRNLNNATWRYQKDVRMEMWPTDWLSVVCTILFIVYVGYVSLANASAFYLR